MTPLETCACGVFWASRDGVLLRVHGYAAKGGAAAIEVGVHRAEPAGVLAAAIAGFGVAVTTFIPWRRRRPAGRSG